MAARVYLGMGPKSRVAAMAFFVALIAGLGAWMGTALGATGRWWALVPPVLALPLCYLALGRVRSLGAYRAGGEVYVAVVAGYLGRSRHPVLHRCSGDPVFRVRPVAAIDDGGPYELQLLAAAGPRRLAFYRTAAEAEAVVARLGEACGIPCVVTGEAPKGGADT